MSVSGEFQLMILFQNYLQSTEFSKHRFKSVQSRLISSSIDDFRFLFISLEQLYLNQEIENFPENHKFVAVVPHYDFY